MDTKKTYEELEQEVSKLQEEVLKKTKTERALKKSEDMLNKTQKLAKIGGWEYHVGKKRTMWTDEVYRIYGVQRKTYDTGDLKRNFSFYAPEDRKTVIRAFKRAVLEGKPYDLELGFISAKGEHIWVRTIANPVMENGKITRIVGNLMDISDRKRANEMLLAERLKLERYFEHIPLMAYNFSLSGRIVDCNTEAVRALEYDSKEALLGQPAISTLYAKSSQNKARKTFERWKLGRRIRNQELEMITRTGNIIHVLLNVVTVFDQNRNPIHAIATHLDITERKRAQKEGARLQVELQRVQEAEAVATLAGGIAHDYNNLLSVIMGNLSLAVEQSNPESELAHFLREASMASLKARELTYELMSLSRSRLPRMKAGSLVELLKDISDVIPTDSGILLNSFIKEGLWSVNHDPSTMRAVLRNIATNAVEAMPKGGTLSIKAENVRPEDMDQRLEPILSPMHCVHISVQDNGLGIAEKDLERIFDPYFTTKAGRFQKGMGLGLATTHAIVERHGGHIAVDSSPGKGTIVDIYFPKAPSEGESLEEQRGRPTPESSIHRVLVMDDEEMLRKLAEQMLRRLGYQAKTVKDGIEAIDAVRRQMNSGKPFDMVILDLTVKGGMGGEQTVRELRKIDPNIKTIVSSGYFDDPVISHYEKYGFMGSMAKPYEMENLKETIEKLAN